MTGKAEAAWAARRALIEGAAPTVERMALACHVSVGTIWKRAQKGGWALRRAASGLSREARIARIHDRLLDKIERAQLATEEEDAVLDKASIAELSATARTLAKISEITRDEDSAKDKQLERDADIAAILDRLDAKIIELARHLAEDMVREGIHAAGSDPGKP